MSDIEIIGEYTLHECGPWRHVRRYLRGWHPKLGQLYHGLSGLETIVEVSVLKPTVKYTVVERDDDVNMVDEQTGLQGNRTYCRSPGLPEEAVCGSSECEE